MASSAVLNASDLMKASASRNKPVAPVAYKTDDLLYDVGLLAAFDSHPIDPAVFAGVDAEAALLQLASDNTQLLIRKIFELPVELTDDGPVAMLPNRSTALPRSKPPPKPKPLTRWQKFALEKGIMKKKRSVLTFDEQTEDWKRRHGKDRANDDTKDWLIPVREGIDDPHADLFEQRELAKKERIVKNQISQVKNIERATKAGDAKNKFGGAGASASADALLMGDASDGSAGGAGALKRKQQRTGAISAPPSSSFIPSAAAAAGSVEGADGKQARKSKKRARTDYDGAGDGSAPFVVAHPMGIPSIRGDEGDVSRVVGHGKKPRSADAPNEAKSTKADRLKVAQLSTASLGRFDKARVGEPPRPKDARKQKRTPNEVGGGVEKARNTDILKRVLGGSGEGEGAAAGGVISSKAAPAAVQQQAAKPGNSSGGGAPAGAEGAASEAPARKKKGGFKKKRPHGAKNGPGGPGGKGKKGKKGSGKPSKGKKGGGSGFKKSF